MAVDDGNDVRNPTGTGKVRGVAGSPGEQILGPKQKWEPGAIPARAARSEADQSISLSGLNPPGAAK